MLFDEVTTYLQGLSRHVKELPHTGTIEPNHRFFTMPHREYLNTDEVSEMKPEQFEQRLQELGYVRGRRGRNRGRGFVKTVTEHDWTRPRPPVRCRGGRDHGTDRVIRYWNGHRTVKCLHCTKTFRE